MRVTTGGRATGNRGMLVLFAENDAEDKVLETAALDWGTVGYLLLRRTAEGHVDALDPRRITYRARYDDHEDPLVPRVSHG